MVIIHNSLIFVKTAIVKYEKKGIVSTPCTVVDCGISIFHLQEMVSNHKWQQFLALSDTDIDIDGSS